MTIELVGAIALLLVTTDGGVLLEVVVMFINGNGVRPDQRRPRPDGERITTQALIGVVRAKSIRGAKLIQRCVALDPRVALRHRSKDAGTS